MGRTSTRPLRRDAAANRERLLEAATSVVLSEGEAVPMTTVADVAGVGIGTLYRHFPTRDDLFGALVEQSLGRVLDNAHRAAEAGTGRECVVAFLHAAIADRNRLVLPLHGGPDVLDAESRRLQAEVRGVIGSMLARGVEDGSLREDVVPLDVIYIGALLSRGLAHAPDWEHVARRQVELYVAGLTPVTA